MKALRLRNYLFSCFAFFVSFLFTSIVSFPLDQIRRDCGANYTVLEGSIMSPNFGASNYDSDTECTWTITVPSNMIVKLEFDSIDIEEDRELDCIFDGVVMYDYTVRESINLHNYQNNSLLLGNTRFCGSLLYPAMFSRTNKVEIKFYSDSDNGAAGFELHWVAVKNPGEYSFNCSFEQGLCAGWKNRGEPDDQDWKLHKENTPTPYTGPQFDHTVQNKHGKYMFIESSFPVQRRDLAMLETPPVSFEDDQSFACLSFWYHMYGNTMGSLLVAKSQDKFPILWTKKGNQGDTWLNGKVQIQKNISNDFKLVFIGLLGEFKSDMALDDVTIFPGNCSGEFGNIVQGQILRDYLEYDLFERIVEPPVPSPSIKCLGLYSCQSETKCIPHEFRCDGQQDCANYDDEFNCPGSTTRNESTASPEQSSSMASSEEKTDEHSEKHGNSTNVHRLPHPGGSILTSGSVINVFQSGKKERGGSKMNMAEEQVTKSRPAAEQNHQNSNIEDNPLIQPTVPSQNSMDQTTTSGSSTCTGLSALTLLIIFAGKLFTLL